VRLCVWVIADGKAGHENQSLGLVQALESQCDVDRHVLPSLSLASCVLHYLCSRFPDSRDLPHPDLIIGAGHGTHATMLTARHARGGRCVTLMKPSLPIGWFDYCICPQHDEVVDSDRVLRSRGVLNRIRAGEKDPSLGLILIGGPSRHHDWNNNAVIAQLKAVINANPDMQWSLTTSRRTPHGFLSLLREQHSQRLTIFPVDNTHADWLPQVLESASQVWVSEDSVSMVYEALSSGAGVGVFSVPRKDQGRITRGLDALIDDQLVRSYSQWQTSRQLNPPAEAFNEAERAARWLLQQCPNTR